MFRCLVCLGLTGCLLLAAEPALNKDFLDLVTDLQAGKDISAKIKAFHKTHDDPTEVMRVFKPRKNGGIGFGTPMVGDGIEFKLVNLSEKAPKVADLTRDHAELLKTAAIVRAMSKLTPSYEPRRLNAVDQKKFREATSMLDKGGQDLAAALARRDPAAVKSAATTINAACVQCHQVIR